MPPLSKLSKSKTLMFLSLAHGNRTQAASMAGVSRSTFHRAMRRGDIHAPRQQWSLSPVDVVAARKLASEGVSLKKIAESLGVHRHTIERAVKQQTFKQVKKCP